MNIKYKKIIKNISYSFSANVMSAIISVVMIVVLPKLMSIGDYGAWQLYIFYLSYVGFFHFGWLNGMYLRYGGIEYGLIDYKKFSGQFYALLIMELLIVALALSYVIIYVKDVVQGNVLRMICMITTSIILTTLSSIVLQFTNRIKEYAYLILSERILFLLLLLFYLSVGGSSYQDLLWIDFVCKLINLCHGIFLIKEIVVMRSNSITAIFQEAYLNICVGSKMMFANIASLLIVGIIRFGISQGWDIATFGKVSLTLSISNFLMVFISAASVVLFPILKRMDYNRLAAGYQGIRNVLSFSLFGFLLMYFPLKECLSMWLPQYAESLVYMAVLFPICLFESKMYLLVNTYLQSLRKEKLILKINVLALLLSAFLTGVSVGVLHSLDLAVFSIVIVLACRCILAELYIEKILQMQVKRDIFIEMILTLSFILLSVFCGGWMAAFVYGVFYIVFLYSNRTKIIVTIQQLKSLAR